MQTVLADMPIIDIDAHFTEPPDFWLSRAPAKFKEGAPRVELRDGKPMWVVADGVVISPPGLCVIKPDGSKLRGKFSLETFEEMSPSAFQLDARLRAMDELGLTMQILYPNVLGFAGASIMKVADVELRNFCTYAYNDAIAELQAASKGRIFAQALLPFWDAGLCAKELARCHETLKLSGFNMTETPEQWGLPSLHDPYWNPLWDEAQARGMPCNFHVASGGISPHLVWEGFTPDKMLATISTFMFMNNGRSIVNLIFSGLLDRYPSLKFVSVESGIGWIPFLLEACEYQMDENMVNRGGLKLRPREYFRRQIYASYWFERDRSAATIEAVGEDNVMFETDYPHPTCLYPRVKEQVQKSLGGLDPRVQRKVLYETAARVYQLPIPH